MIALPGRGKVNMNILDAIRDDKVFGQHFTADTWAAWLAFLSALFALPMTGEQLRAAQSLDRHLPAEYKFAGSQRSIV